MHVGSFRQISDSSALLLKAIGKTSINSTTGIRPGVHPLRPVSLRQLFTTTPAPTHPAKVTQLSTPSGSVRTGPSVDSPLPDLDVLAS